MDLAFIQAGFRWNPFRHREASTDEHLVDYIVNHDAFSAAWGEHPALILAAAGAGKTAMRIFAARTCWTSLGSRHPFPIPYYLPRYFNRAEFFDLDTHLQAILKAAAASLLLGFAYRPAVFLEASPDAQTAAIHLLDFCLPSSFSRYVDILRSDLNPHFFAPLLDPAYTLPDPPPQEGVRELVDAFQRTAMRPSSIRASNSSASRFDQFTDLILHGFGFSSILIYLDGLDSFESLANDPQKAGRAILPLLLRASAWAEQKVFLKGFLPLDLVPLRTAFEVEQPTGIGLEDVFRVQPIVWTVDLLTTMLQQRILVGTGGKFGSLDTLAGPSIHDSERIIASSVPPLPRRALAFAEKVVLIAHHRNKLFEIDDRILDEALRFSLHDYSARIPLLSPFPS